MSRLRALWAKFWAEIRRGESYDSDPYKAALNQFAHYMLGAYAAMAFCILYCIAFGEMPYKTEVLALFALSYLGAIELALQGWRGRDTLIDTAFFTLGVASPLVSVSELSIGPPVTLELHAVNAFVCMYMLPVLLLLHVWRREPGAW
jgi:hypothetical protein